MQPGRLLQPLFGQQLPDLLDAVIKGLKNFKIEIVAAVAVRVGKNDICIPKRGQSNDATAWVCWLRPEVKLLWLVLLFLEYYCFWVYFILLKLKKTDCHSCEGRNP